MKYEDFIQRKRHVTNQHGFKSLFEPDYLFDFQEYLVRWSLQKGRCAIFADTGLGKTPMQLVWAENIVRKTNKNVLIITPLAVSQQTVKEGEKFGIEVKRSRDGQSKGKITITNYQQLHKFNDNNYIACVCDESSAIKNFDGATKKLVTRFMNKMPYRSLWTATPSPNDYVELGTNSEAIGELKYMDMLSQFFRDTSNDKNPQWSTPKYVLKQHGVNDFWRWVCSWARAMKLPSDYGFDDKDFILPELIVKEYVLKATKPLDGELFVRKARTLNDQRQERKLTLKARCEKVAELCAKHDISVIWGHYNYECDYLESVIDNAVQISGKDKDESKEEKLIAFSNGEIKKLITKPKIGAWGLNWQHCNHTTFFLSHSYEQYYQAVRRFYRYGQKRPVYVDTVTTEGELGVFKNIKRKALQAEVMFKKLVELMNDELSINAIQDINNKREIPKWIK